MKKTTTLALLLGIIAIGAMSFDIDTATGISGKTVTGCTCHGSTATTGVTCNLSFSPAMTPGYYMPNTTYTVTATVAYAGELNAGMDLKTTIGTSTVTAGSGTLAGGSNTYIKNGEVTHTGTGNVTSSSSVDFCFTWTSPASGTGNITFTYSALAGNNDGNNSSLDKWNKNLTTTLSESITGITESAISNSNLSVFPNPASDNMNVKFTLKEASDVTVDLMDINGNKVANLVSENGMKGDINKSFNVSSYSKGVYFLKIKDEKSSSLKKIVIE
jgi:hypothetical protein